MRLLGALGLGTKEKRSTLLESSSKYTNHTRACPICKQAEMPEDLCDEGATLWELESRSR